MTLQFQLYRLKDANLAAFFIHWFKLMLDSNPESHQNQFNTHGMFSERSVKLACIASSLAYYTPTIENLAFKNELQELKKFSEKENPITIPFFKKGISKPAGYVIKTSQEIIIAFQGSDSMDHIKSDLDYGKIDIKFGSESLKAHKGFAEAYQDLRQSLNTALESLSKLAPEIKDLPKKFTGHSYGGALAQLAALDLSTKNTNPKVDAEELQVITFGAPRVFSRNAALAYNKVCGKHTIHFQNKGDIIPGLPNKSFDYEHTGYKAIFSGSMFGHSNNHTYRQAAHLGHKIIHSTSLKFTHLDQAESLMKNYRSIMSTMLRVLDRINKKIYSALIPQGLSSTITQAFSNMEDKRFITPLRKQTILKTSEHRK